MGKEGDEDIEELFMKPSSNMVEMSGSFPFSQVVNNYLETESSGVPNKVKPGEITSTLRKSLVQPSTSKIM